MIIGKEKLNKGKGGRAFKARLAKKETIDNIGKAKSFKQKGQKAMKKINVFFNHFDARHSFRLDMFWPIIMVRRNNDNTYHFISGYDTLQYGMNDLIYFNEELAEKENSYMLLPLECVRYKYYWA